MLGPPAVLVAGAAFGIGVGLAATGVVLAVATLAFAADRASRIAGGPAAFAVAGLATSVATGIGILRARTLPGAAVHTPQGATT